MFTTLIIKPPRKLSEMSEQEAARFMEAVTRDEDLRTTLESRKEDPTAVIAEIAARGFDCTPEEIRLELLELLNAELSEEELDQVAAGISQQAINTIQVVGGVTGGAILVGSIAAVAAAI